MLSDMMVENYMIRPLELVKPAKRIDHAKIAAYEKAIDILDDAAEKICFSGADVYRQEIYRIQRQMQEKVWRLEDGQDD
jgi:hypothetical protein